MVENAKESRKAFHPHGDNLDVKIEKNTAGADAFKKDHYLPFVESISKIRFVSKDIGEYEKASALIDKYYAKLSEYVSAHQIDTRSGIKSSFIEELSKYLFINHPVVVREKLLFKNKDICTGSFFSRDTIKTTDKNVDFCICREKVLKLGKDKPFSVRIPIVSVECKTYLDGTMFNEVIDTATRIHASSPDSSNFVLMLWNAVGKETFTVRRKATNITDFFSLIRKPNNNTEAVNIHTDPSVLLAYYNAVSNALDEYFTEYIFPEYGQYLH